MTEFRTASRQHLLVECADLTATMRLHHSLETAALTGVLELVPAARTVLVRFDTKRTSARELETTIRGLDLSSGGEDDARTVTIDVRYDGEDLAEVADLLDVSPAEVVARHQRARWQVAFSGFAPGFGYLAGDDPLFDVPRRSSPRTRVPVGSVGLAGEFTGVYPRSSPGGWQLIGRTDARLWDLDRDPPALFVPGTLVTFREAEREMVRVGGADTEPTADSTETVTDSDSGSGSASAPHALTVVQPGLQLLVEDLGRPGFASMGVSSAGAADRAALREANRLVGNAEDTAALESLGRTVLDVTGDGVAAVTGAEGPITLTGANGDVVRPEVGEAFSLVDGDRLEIGASERGLRRYLSVRGGLAVTTALSSASSDTLGHLGPAALTAEDTIGLHGPANAPFLVDPGPRLGEGRHLPTPGEVVELTVTLGPRDDWFTPAGVATLFDQEWTVTHESDRVGLRLSGDVPLERARTGELPSEGAVTGALQVPPNGQPVLFGPDHPLTGGYPIIGSVDDTDLAAQLAPGVRIRFRRSDSGPAATAATVDSTTTDES
ncbi:carboxyltransferase domain-containing protein [Brevibacterium casei]|uniref:5-oxoprolinase subunit B/C family protein n=1 Tax=Brevibacterium casei TaxID=33889 RepID=UPI0039EF3C85